MKRKPIRVNWEELESAFDNQNSDLQYRLDLINGHVELEGEGNDADYEDEDDPYDLGSVNAPPLPSDPTKQSIETLSMETKVAWMRQFVDEADGIEEVEPELVDKLREALAGEEPAPAIIAALGEHPEGKDAWYRFRSERLHDLMDDWLESHGITVIDPPPWRTPS